MWALPCFESHDVEIELPERYSCGQSPANAESAFALLNSLRFGSSPRIVTARRSPIPGIDVSNSRCPQRWIVTDERAYLRIDFTDVPIEKSQRFLNRPTHVVHAWALQSILFLRSHFIEGSPPSRQVLQTAINWTRRLPWLRLHRDANRAINAASALSVFVRESSLCPNARMARGLTMLATWPCS